MEMILA